MVRPQNVSLQAGTADGVGLRGKVLDSMMTGSLTRLYVEAAGAEPIIVSYPTAWPSDRYAVGEGVLLQWHPADAVAVPE